MVSVCRGGEGASAAVLMRLQFVSVLASPGEVHVVIYELTEERTVE